MLSKNDIADWGDSLKTFELQYEEGLSELDYLEKIYKKVRLEELVKFNGKGYMRSTPKNNKYFKHPYHFHLAVKDIYKGNVLFRDSDGEMVNTGCHYKVVIVGDKDV